MNDTVEEYPQERKLKYPDWGNLLDSLLLNIFSYLSFSNIHHISLVCRNWHRVSRDELLWKQFFLQDFKIKKGISKAAGMSSWLSEYKRLVDKVPLIECELLDEHQDQVLHVSFSHNGKMFATTSKDGTILVWSTGHPAEVIHYRDMKTYSWKYTQFSQFNSDDTLLLVSGVHFGSMSTSGEIAIFNLEKDFQLQCRSLNKPYDIFGSWYNNQYFISGDLKWLGQMISANILWLNKASQGLKSEHEVILMKLSQFYNIKASSVRMIMVANCMETEAVNKSSSYCTQEENLDTFSNSSSDSSEADLSREGNLSYEMNDSQESIIQDVQSLSQDKDKYLIFSTGTKTYFPHVIGFKRITNFEIPETFHVDPSELKERYERQKTEQTLRNQGLNQRQDWQNFEAVKEKFDPVDFSIDVHGHIIGMALSPDHRFLYVNSRPWPPNVTLDDLLHPPVISQEIDIHVIDLVNLKEVGSLLRSHLAYTKSDNCFFIFLDVAPHYVASGAEDRHAYIWERHYEVCLCKLPHKDVVNSVAFNPIDSEMLVTVSDDYRIKVWRSRRKARELGIPLTKENTGSELRESHSINDDKELIARLQSWKDKRGQSP